VTKLCPRGKAAAQRKFKVYPSAYANAYASKICAGKIKDPSGKKRKDFRGPKPSKAMGGRIYKAEGGSLSPEDVRKVTDKVKKFSREFKLSPGTIKKMKEIRDNPNRSKKVGTRKFRYEKGKYGPKKVPNRERKMGGGMTMMPRAMYNKGGKIPTTPKEKTFAALAAPKDRITFADKIAGATGRQKKKGGGLMEATSRLRAQGLKAGGVAKGCGAVMSDRRKVTKVY
jgi:hypothetical protein